MSSPFIWKITADHIADPSFKPPCNSNAVGMIGPSDADEKLLSLPIVEHGKPFRMYDDDGELYYEGVLVLDPTKEEDEEAMFSPLDNFGMPNAGCTTLAFWQLPKPLNTGLIIEGTESEGYWVML